MEAQRWHLAARRRQDEIHRLEANASVIRVFARDVVVGFAQTRPYAEAMFHTRPHSGDDEPLDEIVDARLARQETLNDPSKRFEFVMDEIALRRRLISAADMRDQIAATDRAVASTRTSTSA